MKNEKYKKSLTTTTKFFTSFVCGKECILLENNSLGKCSLYYYISSKFFSIAEYLKRSNETLMST